MWWRACLIVIMGGVVLILGCCGLFVIVGIPRFRDDTQQVVAENLSTQIAVQLPGRTLSPGVYTISVSQIERALRDGIRSQGDRGTTVTIQGLSIDVVGDRLKIGLEGGEAGVGQSLGYTGVPVARDGVFVLDDMTADNGVLDFIISADQVGDAVEQGVNDFFTTRGLRIDAVELKNGQIVVEASERDERRVTLPIVVALVSTSSPGAA